MVRQAQVSPLGRFRTKLGKVYSPNPGAGGYCRVQINGKAMAVHRLVALRFLPPPAGPDQTRAEHIDNVKHNNQADNLRWASPRENRTDAAATRRWNASRRQSKPVKGRRVGEGPGWTLEFESTHEAARQLGLKQGHVSNCCIARRTSTCGYEFVFGQPMEPALLPGEEWREYKGGVDDMCPRSVAGGITSSSSSPGVPSVITGTWLRELVTRRSLSTP